MLRGIPIYFGRALAVASCIAATAFAGPADCVDLLALERFYYYPELLSASDAERTRAWIRERYPELPPLVGVLRPAHAEAHNSGELARLTAQSHAPVSLATARSLLRAVQHHPVASLAALSKFETSGARPIGFCYGRAYAMYREARRRGIADRSMRKVFLVGELLGSGIHWDFHAALAVAGDNAEGWWMQDPVLAEPVLPSEWLRLWTTELATDPEGLALLFSAPPEQLARNPRTTIEEALASPVVGDYFRSLHASFD